MLGPHGGRLLKDRGRGTPPPVPINACSGASQVGSLPLLSEPLFPICPPWAPCLAGATAGEKRCLVLCRNGESGLWRFKPQLCHILTMWPWLHTASPVPASPSIERAQSYDARGCNYLPAAQLAEGQSPQTTSHAPRATSRPGLGSFPCKTQGKPPSPHRSEVLLTWRFLSLLQFGGQLLLLST